MAITDRNISKYVVFTEDDIVSVLKKISQNKVGFAIAVNEKGVVEGLVTDGDFRRWIVSQNDIDLTKPVSVMLNRDFKYLDSQATPEQIQSSFSERIRFVLLLDKQRHLVAVVLKGSQEISIGNFTLGPDSPSFVIAEIGNNHNGSLELAKKLIDEAISAGADCAKFQLRQLGALYNNSGNANDASEDLGSQYTLDLLSRFQLSNDEMFEAFDYCKSKNILPLCTPWDIQSLRLLEQYGMPAYKVASADLTNHEFLTALAKTNKPLIVSTGMSSEEEIIQAVALLKRNYAQYVLLHCNSTYPAPFKDVNLKYMDRLKTLGDCMVGYSGHERGIHVSIAAVGLGAKVIEKHFTLDRGMEGNDHKVSLLPEEFKRMVLGIREVEESLGQGSERKITQGELMNREILGKSLVINRDLNRGEVITADMIEVKSPGKGISPYRKPELVGKKAIRNFKAGEFFFPSDVDSPKANARPFTFRRPWGVPVRYHDVKSMLAETNCDLLEFHLSYKDLDEKIEKYFKEPLNLDFVVHSPELFAGDHIMDLASPDEAYRKHSVAELQRVIEVTRALKPFFKRSVKPQIIINAGGFTQDAPLKKEQRKAYYDRILKSLKEVDSSGVEIIPQTMPPFPWHFGGQRYQNLFMDPWETAEFCKAYNMRVCFDVSHSKLACNHHKWSFHEFVKQVGPYTAHLHLVDASGVDGEGLQIADGEIDFSALAEDLAVTAPKASFIPEIWQGHKNSGEGFWVALDRLEKWF